MDSDPTKCVSRGSGSGQRQRTPTSQWHKRSEVKSSEVKPAAGLGRTAGCGEWDATLTLAAALCAVCCLLRSARILAASLSFSLLRRQDRCVNTARDTMLIWAAGLVPVFFGAVTLANKSECAQWTRAMTRTQPPPVALVRSLSAACSAATLPAFCLFAGLSTHPRFDGHACCVCVRVHLSRSLLRQDELAH